MNDIKLINRRNKSNIDKKALKKLEINLSPQTNGYKTLKKDITTLVTNKVYFYL